MIRPKWAIINGLTCIVLALAIISPVIPYALSFIIQIVPSLKISITLPEAYLFAALTISGVIASAIVYTSYRVAMKNAEEFIIKAEEENLS